MEKRSKIIIVVIVILAIAVIVVGIIGIINNDQNNNAQSSKTNDIKNTTESIKQEPVKQESFDPYAGLTNRKYVEAAFEVYDYDGSGYLTGTELMAYFGDGGAKYPALATQEYISRYDKNRDGMISIKEMDYSFNGIE